ncbi:hypothetical protein K501DRAFT_127396, partial [Backusella circina FSU 941]
QGISYEFNCIFVDESGFNTSQIRKYGRSKKSKLAKVIVEKDRSIYLTIVAAMSFKGVELIHVKTVKGGTTAAI